MIFWGIEAYSLQTDNIALQYIMIYLAAVCSYMVIPTALAWPLDWLSGSTAIAVAPAIVVGVGNIGGIVGPQLFGLSATLTGDYTWACLAMSLSCFLGVLSSTWLWVLIRKDAIDEEEVLLDSRSVAGFH